ncbi:MAG: hypothetical protein ACRED0_08995 [Gammaproteobacteria bacterium]
MSLRFRLRALMTLIFGLVFLATIGWVMHDGPWRMKQMRCLGLRYSYWRSHAVAEFLWIGEFAKTSGLGLRGVQEARGNAERPY